ncbi:hypothetical protein AB7849_14745 [Rhodanobacter sp. 115]|uniref:hypothetical protein n=1 Tax=Rhodanobacter sp. FW021-MT20 TaxID=1162282 RepID=UPI0034E5A8B4
MTRLAIEQAPRASLPRRFLLAVPLWGMAGGVLLCLDGSGALLDRWQPATLALVHVYALGVLGNTMFGSLLQFTPVVVGARPLALRWLGWPLYGLLNVGGVLLVCGLRAGWTLALTAAGILLPLSFMLLAAMLLPGILCAVSQRLLRAGFVVSLVSALVAAVLGGRLALGLGGNLAALDPDWVDMHASWAVLGWVIVLVASVARIVMPMFQGTDTVPAPVQTLWLGSLVTALVAGGWMRAAHVSAVPLRQLVAVHVLLFAGALLWMQWRATRLRRGALLYSWRIGLVTLAAAALVLLVDADASLLAAVLGLAIGLPLLVNGMAFEIVAFLSWIDLRRCVRRGIQLPGVQRLLPERDKLQALSAQVLADLLLVAAVCWPQPWLARATGLALLLTWGGQYRALAGASRRGSRFLLTVEDRP